MADVLDDELLDSIPQLRDSHRTVEPLPGGLTNHNYKVTTGHGRFVVRLSSADSELLAINRDHEHQNSVIAAAAGVGAPVIAYRPDARMMVVSYLDGVTFTDESFDLPGNLTRVAAAVRKLHDGPRFVNDFNMFDIQRGYLSLVNQRGFRLPPDYGSFAPQVEQIRQALQANDQGTVACNNDLLAGNFVDTGDQLWLIDYEYSGNNDPCFELGNIWSECHLSLDQLEELVTAYYGRPLRNQFARAQLQGLMSRYGWTLWASIQHSASTLDFDFWTWGMQKYEAAVETFRGPEFNRLLAEAQRGD
ncbi:MAG: phosphotransferase [Jatrophihabitantaceae bacterium]